MNRKKCGECNRDFFGTQKECKSCRVEINPARHKEKILSKGDAIFLRLPGSYGSRQ